MFIKNCTIALSLLSTLTIWSSASHAHDGSDPNHRDPGPAQFQSALSTAATQSKFVEYSEIYLETPASVALQRSKSLLLNSFRTGAIEPLPKDTRGNRLSACEVLKEVHLKFHRPHSSSETLALQPCKGNLHQWEAHWSTGITGLRYSGLVTLSRPNASQIVQRLIDLSAAKSNRLNEGNKLSAPTFKMGGYTIRGADAAILFHQLTRGRVETSQSERRVDQFPKSISLIDVNDSTKTAVELFYSEQSWGTGTYGALPYASWFVKSRSGSYTIKLNHLQTEIVRQILKRRNAL